MDERDYLKLKLEHAKLQGEFLGFCEGLLWWELPEELRDRVKENIKRLKNNENQIIKETKTEILG